MEPSREYDELSNLKEPFSLLIELERALQEVSHRFPYNSIAATASIVRRCLDDGHFQVADWIQQTDLSTVLGCYLHHADDHGVARSPSATQ